MSRPARYIPAPPPLPSSPHSPFSALISSKRPTDVYAQVQLMQLTRLLDQLQSLSKTAHEVLDGLQGSFGGLQERLESVQGRIRRLDEDGVVDVGEEGSGGGVRRHVERTSHRSQPPLCKNMFVGVPTHLKEVYDGCTAIPALHLLDEFREDGKRCVDLFGGIHGEVSGGGGGGVGRRKGTRRLKEEGASNGERTETLARLEGISKPDAVSKSAPDLSTHQQTDVGASANTAGKEENLPVDSADPLNLNPVPGPASLSSYPPPPPPPPLLPQLSASNVNSNKLNNNNLEQSPPPSPFGLPAAAPPDSNSHTHLLSAFKSLKKGLSIENLQQQQQEQAPPPLPPPSAADAPPPRLPSNDTTEEISSVHLTGLLAEIRTQKLTLRKVESPQRLSSLPGRGNWVGLDDVGAILRRRVAMEMSDSEEEEDGREGGFGDWD
ncbi:hypothetical protein HDV05_006158 [Chytridiales sp. JEL 0842]|nr:hypothetical protein HDV05_006158 [Chytridiales sp. JEL 0842]